MPKKNPPKKTHIIAKPTTCLQMLKAALEGNLHKVLECRAKQIDIGAKDLADYWHHLMDAITAKNTSDLHKVRVMKAFGATGMDVSAADKSGSSPLALALTNAPVAIAQALVDAAENMDVNVWHGKCTMLMLAVKRGSPHLLQALLARNPDTELADDHGNTALMHAAQENWVQGTEMLLNAGADLSHRSKHQQTAFTVALLKHSHEVMLKLFDVMSPEMRDAQKLPAPALHHLMNHAVAHGRPDVVTVLRTMAEPKLPDAQQSLYLETLLGAIINGDSYSAQQLQMVKACCATGMNLDVSVRKMNPLISAILIAPVDVVRALLDAKADPNPLLEGSPGALQAAIWRKCPDLVRCLIAAGANVDGQGRESKEVPLHAVFQPERADHECMVEILQILLEANVNIEIADDLGITPLMSAASSGSPKLLQCLLERTPQIDLTDNDESTALMFAVEKNDLQSVELLLEAGANPFHQNRHQLSVADMALSRGGAMVEKIASAQLLHAARQGNSAQVVELRAKGVLVPGDQQQLYLKLLLDAICKEGVDTDQQIALVKALAATGMDLDALDSEGVSPLQHAAQHAPVAVVRALLEAHASPNLELLVDAIYEESVDGNQQIALVKAFAATGMDLDALDSDAMSPLVHAVQHAPVGVVQALLEANANPNLGLGVHAIGPLEYAAGLGRQHVVSALIQHGAQVDAKSHLGSNALLAAVYLGPAQALDKALNGFDATASAAGDGWHMLEAKFLAVVQELLDAHADVDVVMHNGASALFLAVDKQYDSVVHALLARGANVDLQTKMGHTALMAAVWQNRADLAQAILAREADIDAADGNGNTALMHAVMGGWAPGVALLLEAGADPERENHWHMNASDLVYSARGSGENKMKMQWAIVNSTQARSGGDPDGDRGPQPPGHGAQSTHWPPHDCDEPGFVSDPPSCTEAAQEPCAHAGAVEIVGVLESP